MHTARRVKKGILIALPVRLLSVFKLAALVCIVAISNVTFGETSSAKAVRGLMPRLDQFVEAEMQRQKVPGVAVGIVSGSVVIAAKGYGYANVELSVPVTADTIFQAGSVGKPVTAMAVIEVEDGKLALGDALTKYFSDAPHSWGSITVRNLLNHTSGIPDWAFAPPCSPFPTTARCFCARGFISSGAQKALTPLPRSARQPPG